MAIRQWRQSGRRGRYGSIGGAIASIHRNPKGDSLAALVLALVLLATVLASSVIAQLLPRISLPLIQIACGIVVALIARGQIAITLNPELFLVLFIAPLLFHEAREADKASLWKNRRSMLSYAIGLVIAIVLVVGFTLNWLAPSIPLAAAFALGAALGPTDPIAVASVAKQADIPQRQKTVLQGESLLNDASGIVSFQFAVAAVVTGSFSAVEAVGEFLLSFFGALLAGIVLGFLLAKGAEKVRDMGLATTTFHVALEILAPFIAYLLGEAIHVSGVILVVACGITMSLMPRSINPSISRMNIVSSSVWEVLTFALNGIVFVMLGTQLPQAFGGFWIDEGISNFDAVLIIVIITLLMYGVRFLWTLVSEGLAFKEQGEEVPMAQRLRSAAVMTLAGAKGAITLAIMFSIPIYVNDGTAVVAFPQRDLLIFLSCGVILLSLLGATFAVPLLAPRREDPCEQCDRDNEAKAEIFRGVIEELTAKQTPENARALGPVIAKYTERLEQFKEEEDLHDESDTALRLEVLQWEQEYVLGLIEKDEVPPLEGYQYVSRSARISSMIKHDSLRKIAFIKWFRRLRMVTRKLWKRLRNRMPGEGKADESSYERIMRDIQIRTSEYVIGRLGRQMNEPGFQSEKISQLMLEYQRTLSMLRGPGPSVTAFAKNADLDLRATRLGLRIELEKIQQAYEEERLSRAEAQKMRENVYLMQIDLEDYM